MSAEITVVIATLPTRAQMLTTAVRSVMAQTLPARVVVVEPDDRGRGAAATKNAGLAQVRTEWVAFLDDDDEFMPDHLRVLHTAATEAGADVAYSLPLVRDQLGRKVDRINEWGGGEVFDPEALRRGSYIQTTSLVRTESAKRVGGFQCPPGSNYDDWGFFLALLDGGAVFTHVHRETFVWNHHGANSSGVPGKGDAPARQDAPDQVTRHPVGGSR